MGPFDPRAIVQTSLLCAAFWVALAGFHRREPREGPLLRFALALVGGAVLAHLGWIVLHADAVGGSPRRLLDLRQGYCVLFVPLGLLLAAPRGRGPAARSGFLAAAFASLLPALAVARLGCLAAGCCRGSHPTALYEVGALAALQLGVRRLPARWVAPAALAGFGLIRLGLEPLRAPPPLGPPLVAPALLGAAWVVAACALAASHGCKANHPASEGALHAPPRVE